MWETVIGSSTIQSDGSRLVVVDAWDAVGANVGVAHTIPAHRADEPREFRYALRGIVKRMERRGAV